ncbi:hypothetical protein LTR48_001833 [Friedmanniomyces endolithicus]|nr:hypothetical protein LTR48_001833 [Friedmanniomyces endolithicus]
MAASYFATTPRLATPQQSTAKSPSPNYFGFQAQDSSAFLADPPQHAKQSWSPPPSAVRSTAAASPTAVPVDQDPRFDAFRRQSEGKAFNLGGLGGDFKMDAPPSMPKLSKSNSKAGEKHGLKPGSQTREMPPSSHRRLGSVETVDAASAELMRSPKRVLSPGSAAQPVPVRKGSPAHFHPQGEERPQSAQGAPRFKLPLDDISGAKAFAMMQRSETLPEGNPSDSDQYFVAPQRVVTLLQSHPDDVLILDLRVSTHYAKSHLTSALNLCIPTTLLKRPSYNVQKLAETFKDDAQKSRFENWRNSSYIIVYDAASAHLKDAQICMNMIKKFQSDGYEGALHIVKGGFADFSKAFAQYVEAGVDAILSQLPGAGSLRLGVAPVIGGCPMPLTDKPANPFFGNIRQNMDLIGGVGQIPVKHPQKETTDGEYPDWLRKAADDTDQGQRVSTKFEAIERREKKRMEDALSGKVSYGSSTSAASRPPQIRKDSSVQIAGLEKGAKNSVIDMLKRQRVARVRKGKRAGTPMEVDEHGHGLRGSQEVEKARRGSGVGGDFFRSQYQADDHEGEGIDGPWVEAEDVDLVEKTVEDFRRQRLSMVQSLRQFVLCYESVMEWLSEQSPVGEGGGSLS